MRKMKDSGIEWIGEIPSKWEVCRLSNIFRERKCKNKGNQESNVLSLSYGNIKQRNVNDNMGLLPDSFETYNIVEPNNIVLRLTDLQNDHRSLRCGLVKERGIITSAYVTLESISDVNCRYFYLLIHSFDVMKGFYNMGDGVRQNLKYNGELSKLFFVLPSLSEQQAIASYLDKKCGEIDETISTQKTIVEKLKAYKQSLITETVCKGLDPNAPMKDGGIEWIGEIPSHWEVGKLKYHAILNPKYDNHFEQEDITVSFVPMECLKNGYILPCNSTLKECTTGSYNYFANNDVIMAKVTPCFENGNIAKATDLTNGIGFGSSELYVFRCFNILADFMLYFLQNKIFKQLAESTMYGTGGLKRVSTSFICNYKFPLPPLPEQQAIASYLDDKCTEIDKAISEKEQIIEKLAEYKKSLIYECVTGKQEVLA